MNFSHAIAAFRQFFHVRWEFSLAAAERNYKDRVGLYMAAAKQVAVVIACWRAFKTDQLATAVLDEV